MYKKCPRSGAFSNCNLRQAQGACQFLIHKSGKDVVAQERNKAEEDYRDAQQNDDFALALGEAERREVTVGFIDPGCLDELQVVEERNDVVQNSECDERVMSRGSSAEEQVELAEESCERWDACQAEHRNRKGDAKARILLRKSAERLECLFAVVPDDAEHEECEVV